MAERVRSEPRSVAPEEINEEQDQTPQDNLAPNQVKLSDGRVVTLRRTNALDSTRIETLAYDLFSTSMGIVSPGVMLRCQALNAISEIDGHLRPKIKEGRALEHLMQSTDDEDMDLIADRYMEVMGRKQKMLDAIKAMKESGRSDDDTF